MKNLLIARALTQPSTRAPLDTKRLEMARGGRNSLPTIQQIVSGTTRHITKRRLRMIEQVTGTLGSGIQVCDVGYDVSNTRPMVGSIASSLLHVLGYTRTGGLTTADLIALFITSIPVLPFLAFLGI
jgi:hypothetical protein